jgi:hypothetical protein
MGKLKYRRSAWVAGLRYLLLLYRLFGERFDFFDIDYLASVLISSSERPVMLAINAMSMPF